MLVQQIEALQEYLSTPKRVVITTHHKPDADALGSSLGFARYLQKKGHDVSIITPSDYPRFLFWMPDEHKVIAFEGKKNKKKAAELIANAELIACLDFSVLSRLHDLAPLVEQSSCKKLMVDHHINPENFAEFVYHNDKAAATAELIYELIELLGDKNLIDVAIGECLYAGMMTDTGSFRHPSTTPQVHRIAANLLELGVNTNLIHRKIFDSASVSRMKFLGFVLSEKLVVLPEYRVAYFAVTSEELKRYNSQTGDTEGVVNFALQIEGIVMAAIFVDRVDAIKISFRSVEEFAVNELASTYFNGGGHKNAAGGKTEGISLQDTVQRFLDLLPKYKETLLKVP